MKRTSLVLMIVVLMTGAVNAQTVTGSGAAGAVPQFTGSSTVGNSPISVSGGNVGIGTPSPSYMLHVNGEAFADAGFRVSSWSGDDVNGAPWYGLGQSPNISLWDGHYQVVQLAGYYGLYFRTGNGQMVMRGDTGNVGIGTENASSALTVDSDIESVAADDTGGALLLRNPTKGTGGTAAAWKIYNMTGAYGNSLQFWDYDTIGCGVPGGVCNSRLTLMDSGNVGIGTMAPSAKMEVNGGIKLTSGSGGSIVFQDGTTQSTAYTGVLCGGDYAESINVTGDRKAFEPGDVLVIDVANPGSFLKSTEPYSRIVSGIYSTKPGVVGRRQAKEKSSAEVPMAMIGIVPTKVVAENGPIQVGDLLVTSSTLGHAMKGTDQGRLMGAVIGKALGSLSSGTGVIEVLVTLQ